MSDPTRDVRTVPPKVSPQETASSVDEHTAGIPASSSSEDDFSFLEGPQSPDELGRLDHFRVLKELGRGGMGCVLLAEDFKLERQVALKVMLPQYAKNATAKERFLREAKAAAKIRHDHVIAILQVGEANGVPYIAMDYLKGMPLDKYLKEKGDLPPAMVLRIGREIALGLAEAHKLGMIHRDIKPANVWLEAPKGRVKILDFGLARREEDGEAHLTQSGAIVGTPAYMAPEQASGEKLDARADLFSLGVLLYRLSTGQAPFNGPTTTAMLLQVMTHEPGLASKVKPGVSLEMARIIAKLMAKKKEDRYGSAAAFLTDWERLMKAPKPDVTQTTIKPTDPEKPVQGRPEVTRNIDPPANTQEAAKQGPRRQTSRLLVLASVSVVLAVGVGLWILFLRTPSVDPGNGNQPLFNAKEPPPLDATNAKEVQAAWAAKLKVPIEDKSPTGIVMTLIPPGELVLYPYRLGKYEVTQEEWQSVMGNNPSTSKGPRLPVEYVTWYDSVEFCNKLSEREGLKPYYDLQVKERKGATIEKAEVKIVGGPGYHIPADGEWENGCRAGTKWKYSFGDNDAELGEYAWYDQNSGKKTHVVGELKPNGFGLYDIHGNVREWNEALLTTSTTGPPDCVARGGNRSGPASFCAVSYRSWHSPASRNHNFGLRLARGPFGEATVAVNPTKELPALNETNATEVQAAWAAKLKGKVEEKSPTGIVMTLIPPGELVKYPYYMGKHEVTQEQWEMVMEYNPSEFRRGGPQKNKILGIDTRPFPVEKVTWFDCVEFCNKLSDREGLKPYYELKGIRRSEKDGKQIEEAEVTILGGTGYHLPTDSEWEHGCRAGTTTRYSSGIKEEELEGYAWYKDTSGGRPHAVGELKPNGFGLYDVHGNVQEWTEEMLAKAPMGVAGPLPRGGSWNSSAQNCAITYRNRYAPSSGYGYIGFRVVRLPSQKVDTGIVSSKEPPPLDATNAKDVQAAWAAKLKVPIDQKSPTGIVMTLIPPGEMVDYPYRLGKYELTQGEWAAVMGEPVGLEKQRLPKADISWYDSVEFCNKLSEREMLPPYYALEVKARKGVFIEEAEVRILGGPGYHIPTDAEWEHGCRAGTKSKYSFGDNDDELGEYAWYDQNSGKKSHPVGELKPNGFGLYDVHGNVREWNEEMLKNATSGAPERVHRGGSWYLTPSTCAVSSRSRTGPATRSLNFGLRPARVPFGEANPPGGPAAKESPPLKPRS